MHFNFMKKKVISILSRKKNIYILCVFLLFFPLKTQLQNILIFAFDHLFRNGITSKIFSYNYTGTFIGCIKVGEMINLNPTMNWFQKHSIYFIQFLPSLFAFWYLYKRYKKDNIFKLLDWFLVLVSCFSIYTAINDLYFLLIYFENYNINTILRLLPTIVAFLSIGIFIFFKIFSFKERLQTIVFSALGFYASLYLWMKFLGPKILPIIL